MAIGLSHPASGDVDAIALLQPLQTDAIDLYVRAHGNSIGSDATIQRAGAQGSFRNKTQNLSR